MKKLYIVANWKSNKTIKETEEWLHRFSNELSKDNYNPEQKEIIIAPSFTSLEHANYCVSNLKLPVKFCAQNISPFNDGAYTGEINGEQIKELADYVLIGHSERRINFKETDEELFRKNDLAKASGLITIFCVQGKETKVPANVDIVAYEPIDAIGTGNPDTPGNADDVAAYFKVNFKISKVIYGGSVNSRNANEFTRLPNMDGVLVGRASLDAKDFYAIIQNA